MKNNRVKGNKANIELDEKVYTLKTMGLTYEEIGKRLKFTRGRAFQRYTRHIKNLEIELAVDNPIV